MAIRRPQFAVWRARLDRAPLKGAESRPQQLRYLQAPLDSILDAHDPVAAVIEFHDLGIKRLATLTN